MSKQGDRFDSQELFDTLVAHGHIVPVGVQGAFGRGAQFEDVLERFNDLVSDIARDDGAETRAFPPIVNRKVIEKNNYMESFPHLCGTVFSFFGKELQARELAQKAASGEPWGEYLGITDVCLTPAICYPLYPTLKGVLPKGGRLFSMLGWAYRHEPSAEPTRMQSFRMREFIRAGSAGEVVEWRDMWLERGLKLLRSLGLEASSDVASDPFFGRGGKMMAANQKEQRLKFEVLIPVISRENPTACCSFNFHQDHFGSKWDIRTSDGAVANTACLGFGLERIVMALFKTHGMEIARWPADVRRLLWPVRPLA
ncbi:amino acid--[acyl-carrier-protein] ligase [Povalibacter sp.]|uniref:amino acid--[acyl-carrier-protein] ligase n=1 Tax=Povalibacter sp. TaxID=1962978 RepID=UPI0032C246AA